MKSSINEIRSMPSLIRHLSQGQKAKYLYFWGHQPMKDGRIGKTCFSQWFSSPFIVDDDYYPTAEHFMMAEKAKLFGDLLGREAVLQCSDPGKAKKLGRTIKHFDQKLWESHRFDIVVTANEAKFSQDEALKDFLLSTGKRVLVEASPVDKIWGIGMAADNPDIDSPFKWKGGNLLGFALMEVRQRLAPITT